MSWWTNIRDTVEEPFNKIGDVAGGVFNKITGRPSADDVRNQQYAINDQIKAYKDQTALTEKEIGDARAQQDVVKRQINEKQIRSLRNNYRASGGFLNNQGASSQSALGSSNVAGGASKLGTS
jgi:hypothetical protein